FWVEAPAQAIETKGLCHDVRGPFFIRRPRPLGRHRQAVAALSSQRPSWSVTALLENEQLSWANAADISSRRSNSSIAWPNTGGSVSARAASRQSLTRPAA